MTSSNPYESSTLQSPDAVSMHVPRSVSRWVLIGCLLAAAGPVALGAYGLHRESVYAASLPPGTPMCGNGMLMALAVMIVGGPLFGLVGGFFGWLASKV